MGAERTIGLSMDLLRFILFHPPSKCPKPVGGETAAPRDVSESHTLPMATVVPSLLDLLDARDATSRAIVPLVAEFLATHPESDAVDGLFLRLDSEDSVERRNAIEVVAEALAISTRTCDAADPALEQRIAHHLLDRLADDDLRNRVDASSLFARLNPCFVVPHLVQRVFDPDARIRSAASQAVLAVLRRPRGKGGLLAVVSVLLDCISTMSEGGVDGLRGSLLGAAPRHPGEIGRRRATLNQSGASEVKAPDLDRIMRLIPEWAADVAPSDWPPLINMVLDRMFGGDPRQLHVHSFFLSKVDVQVARHVSSPFLSRVARQLAAQAALTKAGLLASVAQKEAGSDAEKTPCGDSNSNNSVDDVMSHELLSRITPLVALKVLPLEAFDDATDRNLYVQGGEMAVPGTGPAEECGPHVSIAAMLHERMCAEIEFREVRRLSAELVGRLRADVAVPMVVEELASAVRRGSACGEFDTLLLTACLFAICSALMARGDDVLRCQVALQIARGAMAEALLWPCPSPISETGGSGIAKVQRGCIDCLALMVRAELQSAPSATAASLSDTASTNLPLPMPEERAESSPHQRTDDSLRNLGETAGGSPQSRSLYLIEADNNNEENSDGLPELCLPGSGALPGAASSGRVLVEEISEVDSVKHGDGKENGTEAQHSQMSPVRDESVRVGRRRWGGRDSDVLAAVLGSLTGDISGVPFAVPWESEARASLDAPVMLPFRICMANVVISACQKIPAGQRELLGRRAVPPLMACAQSNEDSEIRAACLQVLFSATYQLKAPGILPYVTDLCGLATSAMRSSRPNQERLAGGKLLAALLASDEPVLTALSPMLIDVQRALWAITGMDSSPELRLLAEQLLSCMVVQPNQ